jgi:hypothetical protein
VRFFRLSDRQLTGLVITLFGLSLLVEMPMTMLSIQDFLGVTTLALAILYVNCGAIYGFIDVSPRWLTLFILPALIYIVLTVIRVFSTLGTPEPSAPGPAIFFIWIGFRWLRDLYELQVIQSELDLPGP